MFFLWRTPAPAEKKGDVHRVCTWTNDFLGISDRSTLDAFLETCWSAAPPDVRVWNGRAKRPSLCSFSAVPMKYPSRLVVVLNGAPSLEICVGRGVWVPVFHIQ